MRKLRLIALLSGQIVVASSLAGTAAATPITTEAVNMENSKAENAVSHLGAAKSGAVGYPSRILPETQMELSEQALQLLPPSPTPDEVQLALERVGAVDVHMRTATSASASDARDVPADAFSVNAFFADYYGNNGKKHIVFYGTWNFRDDYVNGSGPRDGSAIALSGFPTKCWKNVSDDAVVKSYTGKVWRLDTRKFAGHAKSVREIRDVAKDFKLRSDNGIHQIDMKRVKKLKRCAARRGGSYFYEKNQGGSSGGWSFSLSLGFFSVSYGSSEPDRLQKAARYTYF